MENHRPKVFTCRLPRLPPVKPPFTPTLRLAKSISILFAFLFSQFVISVPRTSASRTVPYLVVSTCFRHTLTAPDDSASRLGRRTPDTD